MSKAADEYQALTIKINPLIARAEQQLAAMQFRVSAEVEMPGGVLLAFMKVDMAWRLMVVNANGDGKPLENMSRLTRLRALALLPQLVDALQASAEMQLEQATQIMGAATAYLDGLEIVREAGTTTL